jgi:hypothetical protein
MDITTAAFSEVPEAPFWDEELPHSKLSLTLRLWPSTDPETVLPTVYLTVSV